jgi:hypothetical protein
MARIPDGPIEPERSPPLNDADLAVLMILEKDRREREELRRQRLAARLGIDLPPATWER